MKVRELMNYLSENYDPDDAIVVQWWDRDHFDTADMTPEQWVDAADYMETNTDTDWGYIHEALSEVLSEYMES